MKLISLVPSQCPPCIAAVPMQRPNLAVSILLCICMQHVVEMLNSKVGVHDMQQASPKAEPGDYKHAVNDVGIK